jgi:hypothetical protein
MSYFQKFFENREMLLQTLQQFASKHDLKFLDKLRAETDKTQFLSKISEANFGFFFFPFASSFKEEPLIGGKTPDWAITINGQEIIVEVLRLNASAEDQKNLDFMDSFIEKMKEIKIGAFLSFTVEDNVNVEDISLENARDEIEKWLLKRRLTHESFVLFNQIEIKFLQYSDDVSYVCFMGMGGQINFDYRRLRADNSPLLKKATKYSEIIENRNMPYIICIYLDFHTWFDKRDLFRCLYGSSCEDATQFPFAFSTIIKDALYYTSDRPLKNVSGILLRQQDDHFYFHNFSSANKLNEENKKLLLNFQYSRK